MILFRLTISKLAALIAVVALNLSVGRAIFAYNVVLLCGLSLIVPVLQVGAFRLFRRRGPSRAFWAGFVAFGLAVSGSFVWALLVESAESGILFTYRRTPLLRVSNAVYEAWLSYDRRTDALIERVGWEAVRYRTGHPLLLGFRNAFVFFLPQILAALAGGVLFHRIARWLGVRQETGDGAAHVPTPID